MTERLLSPPVALALALVLAALGTYARLPATARFEETAVYQDAYYVPQPDWLALLSLGHREALADLLWLRTLVYYGDELVHEGAERHIYDYAEAILALDPDFPSVYRWIGTLAIYRASAVSAADVERAVAIMERGAERFPDDGELAWRTGATLAYELPPLYGDDLAARDRARARAAPYLLRADELGAAPPYAVFSNANLLARIGRAELAVSHLEEMYALTTDDARRAEIAGQIEHLRSEAFAAGFVEQNRRFEDAWGREMPYAPAALYDLVGPVPVIDTTAIVHDGFGRHVLDDDTDLTE